MMRCLLIATAAAFAPPTRPSPRLQRLHAETANDLWKALRPRPHDVVLIDADNCRGKSKWRLSAAALDAAAADAHGKGRLGQDCVVMLDHGERRDCFVSSKGTYATAFAGRRSTADDAIVDCVEHFLAQNRTLTVVTSDFGLRARASYLAARAIRGAPEAGKRRAPETLVRFARSECFADAALADTSIKPSAQTEAFDVSVDRLAKHVLTAPASVRARAHRRRAPDRTIEGSPLGNEQTWMRVVLAERLRWLLSKDANAPSGSLGACAQWFKEEDDDDVPKVLTHRLTDKKHRHELLRFADALRRPPPPDIVEEVEDEEEEERRTVPLIAGNRRLRRKRRKRERSAKLDAVDRGAGTTAKATAKKLLAESDKLEAALRAWLRDEPSPGGGGVVAAAADDAFVENSFHAKPGFGGPDALRCICQNPDEPLWPDGHEDEGV